MKTMLPSPMRKPGRQVQAGGFTLVEILMVLAIIGVLAAIALTILPVAKDRSLRSRAETQLRQIEAAIEAYHAKHGLYPPDNPGGNTAVHQLFYELTGVLWDGTRFTDLHQQPIDMGKLGVGGIVHAAKPGQTIRNFFGDTIPDTVDIGGVKLLKAPGEWPPGVGTPPVPTHPSVNVWRYKSTNPDHNKNSYDLWADLVIRGKIVRISNWERR
ncbi:type II secretion system protein [Fontisphaera persica]|uniref:type II secretion system protein n=1 Tax=Fontisphaera persica TaxID=2974023 RepID=UPI0024C0E077|nr:type II secretion system protein [Fontisphaera persica]WCJ61058.1 type II secretion system protein [Fontisphaera persica]